MTELRDKDQDELHLLYQVTTADLAYFKSQQWSVTYYCFLVDAGLIGVAQLLDSASRASSRFFLIGLALAALVSALVVLFKLENSISVRHARLRAIRASFGRAFTDAWSAQRRGQEYVHSIYILYGGVLVTTSVAIWLVGWEL
jgi:hypothetical protein